MQLLRTNNEVEGWHARLIGKRGAKAKLNFYKLVPLLYSKVALLKVHARMLIQHQVLRQPRPSSVCIHNHLLDAWGRYNDGQLTSFKLLKEVARIYTDINKLKYRKCPDDTSRDEPDTDDES